MYFSKSKTPVLERAGGFPSFWSVVCRRWFWWTHVRIRMKGCNLCLRSSRGSLFFRVAWILTVVAHSLHCDRYEPVISTAIWFIAGRFLLSWAGSLRTSSEKISRADFLNPCSWRLTSSSFVKTVHIEEPFSRASHHCGLILAVWLGCRCNSILSSMVHGNDEEPINRQIDEVPPDTMVCAIGESPFLSTIHHRKLIWVDISGVLEQRIIEHSDCCHLGSSDCITRVANSCGEGNMYHRLRHRSDRESGAVDCILGTSGTYLLIRVRKEPIAGCGDCSYRNIQPRGTLSPWSELERDPVLENFLRLGTRRSAAYRTSHLVFFWISFVFLIFPRFLSVTCALKTCLFFGKFSITKFDDSFMTEAPCSYSIVRGPSGPLDRLLVLVVEVVSAVSVLFGTVVDSKSAWSFAFPNPTYCRSILIPSSMDETRETQGYFCDLIWAYFKGGPTVLRRSLISRSLSVFGYGWSAR